MFFTYNKWKKFQQTFQACMLDCTLHYLEKLHKIKPFINVQNMGIKPNSYHIQNKMLEINEKIISLILCSPKICPCFPPNKNEPLLVKKTYSKFIKLKAKSTFELNVWTKCAYRCSKLKSSLISTPSFVFLIIKWTSFLILGMNDLHLISKRDIWN